MKENIEIIRVAAPGKFLPAPLLLSAGGGVWHRLRRRYGRKFRTYRRRMGYGPNGHLHRPAGGDEEFVRMAREIVEAHVFAPRFRVNDLADALNMSRTSLYTRLREGTGRPPCLFIRDVRLDKGAAMLVEGGHTLKEIAVMVGLCDSKYFRKLFKVRFGCTPTAYIERKRAELKG